jgi:sugar phosphate isomerase/epimerase
MANTALALAGTAMFGCGKPKDASTEAAGSAVTASGKPMGIQLYTLRDVLKDSSKVKDTIRQLADWGYTELETFGYSNGNLFGMPSKEFDDYVKSVGARVTSGHYGIDVIRGDWARAVADAQAAGQDFMVLPWIDQATRTYDGYKKIIEDVNKAAEVTKAAGIKMQYHNHDFEFQKPGGDQEGSGEATGFDILMEGLDPNLVSLELDLYWVVRAGQDPAQLISKYPGRFEQWHVKDMDKSDQAKNAHVGSGSIDFKQLFTLASQSGMKHWYVEYDTFPEDPMTGAQKSIEYLKTI